MKEKESALYSQYIIDGVRCDMTPAELLEDCLEFPDGAIDDSDNYNDIIDESTEPPLSDLDFSISKISDFVKQISQQTVSERAFSLLYPSHFTKLQIAKALLNRLWSEGHFRLYNLRLWAQWDWNIRPLGNMASFYKSIEACSDYIFGLGVKMSDYLFIENDDRCSVKFFAWLPDDDIEEDDESLKSEHDTVLFKSPFESRNAWIGNTRKCPQTIVPDPNSWVIYIPFDTCKYKLGGSLLAQANGHNGGQDPQIKDPDYFIDCYEVVRELIEDGIIKAGCTVADGGLAVAADKMCGESGLELDINGISSSYSEDNSMNILFGETPGVLIQVNDADYDYLDSQLILQDIAYYPIAKPRTDFKGIRISEKAKNSVADILTALLHQATEGED